MKVVVNGGTGLVGYERCERPLRLARTTVVFAPVCWSSGSTSGRFWHDCDLSGPQCLMTAMAKVGGK